MTDSVLPDERVKQKRRHMLWIVLAAVALLPIVALAALSAMSSRPDNLGVHDGRLTSCSSSPNCVSTFANDATHFMEPLELNGPAPDAIAHLNNAVSEAGGEVITAEAHYLHAEFTSRLFRFTDDVEFLIDEQAGVIHFRSASRVGYSDFGANRQRMKEIIAKLQ